MHNAGLNDHLERVKYDYFQVLKFSSDRTIWLDCTQVCDSVGYSNNTVLEYSSTCTGTRVRKL